MRKKLIDQRVAALYDAIGEAEQHVEDCAFILTKAATRTELAAAVEAHQEALRRVTAARAACEEDRRARHKAVTGRLLDAIQTLPVLPDKLPQARETARSFLFYRDWPSADRRGDKAAIRELGQLAKKLQSASRIFEDLPEEALIAIRNTGSGVVGFINLHSHLMRIEQAKASLEAKPVKAQAGAPKKQDASRAADLALKAYENLTGKKAGAPTDRINGGRYGKFLNFLAEIFSILNIEASPEEQALGAIKRRKEKVH